MPTTLLAMSQYCAHHASHLCHNTVPTTLLAMSQYCAHHAPHLCHNTVHAYVIILCLPMSQYCTHHASRLWHNILCLPRFLLYVTILCPPRFLLCHNTVPTTLPTYVTVLCTPRFPPMAQYCAHHSSRRCHVSVPEPGGYMLQELVILKAQQHLNG